MSKMKLKIKKGSNVKVIAGDDKGKTGSVLELNTNAMQVKVSGVNMKTHFDREEGMMKREGFIDYSNVALVK